MLNIKRVLWIEDNETELDDRIKDIFIDKEKKTISNMEDAIKEFSSDHLYDYDTIVLDIDFRNDNSDIQTIINELNKRIFLEKEYNHDDLKHNGGYFLFLYLLERGYPSDRIAFLTGYDDIIHKLNIYNMMMRKVLSFDEIVEIFKEKWNEAEKEKKPNSFETSIYNNTFPKCRTIG